VSAAECRPTPSSASSATWAMHLVGSDHVGPEPAIFLRTIGGPVRGSPKILVADQLVRTHGSICFRTQPAGALPTPTSPHTRACACHLPYLLSILVARIPHQSARQRLASSRAISGPEPDRIEHPPSNASKPTLDMQTDVPIFIAMHVLYPGISWSVLFLAGSVDKSHNASQSPVPVAL